VITESARITFEGDTWVVLEISKSCLVVLTRAEFIAALKRGKAWRRSAAMKARLGQKEGSL
jgi:hypothetical protein